jgi:type IV secretion system protein VirD4
MAYSFSISLGLAWNTKTGRSSRPVFYDSDRHLTLFGPTGSGKGICLEIPNLLSLTGLSTISIDPKGENASVTARWRRTVSDVVVINPMGLLVDQRPDLASAGFNPLVGVETFEHAAAIAEALIKVEGDSQPFFPESARGLMQALIMWEVKLARDEGRLPSLRNVRRILTEAELTDKDGRPIAGLRKTAADMIAFGGPQIASLAGRFIEKGREIAAIISTADTQTRFLLSDPMGSDLERDGIDWSRLKGPRPVTVYVILPAEYLETHAGSVWLRLVITSALNALYRTGGQGGLRTLFLLSETAQLGKLDSLAAALAQGRGFGCQLALVLQDYSQLRTIYGPDAANTFLGMSGAIFGFTANEPQTAEWMSRRSGEVDEMGLSASDDPNGAEGARINYQHRRRRLYAPDDLFNIPPFHGLVWFAGRAQPQPVYVPPYFERPELAGRYDPNPWAPRTGRGGTTRTARGILAAMARWSWIFNAAAALLLLAILAISGRQPIQPVQHQRVVIPNELFYPKK